MDIVVPAIILMHRSGRTSSWGIFLYVLVTDGCTYRVATLSLLNFGICTEVLRHLAVNQIQVGKSVGRISIPGKGKVHPRTGHEGLLGEYRYTSTYSLTSALDGVGGQRNPPGRFTPGKDPVPIYRRLDGPQGRSGRVRKISPQRDSVPRPSSP